MMKFSNAGACIDEIEVEPAGNWYRSNPLGGMTYWYGSNISPASWFFKNWTPVGSTWYPYPPYENVRVPAPSESVVFAQGTSSFTLLNMGVGVSSDFPYQDISPVTTVGTLAFLQGATSLSLPPASSWNAANAQGYLRTTENLIVGDYESNIGGISYATTLNLGISSPSWLFVDGNAHIGRGYLVRGVLQSYGANLNIGNSASNWLGELKVGELGGIGDLNFYGPIVSGNYPTLTTKGSFWSGVSGVTAFGSSLFEDSKLVTGASTIVGNGGASGRLKFDNGIAEIAGQLLVGFGGVNGTFESQLEMENGSNVLSNSPIFIGLGQFGRGKALIRNSVLRSPSYGIVGFDQAIGSLSLTHSDLNLGEDLAVGMNSATGTLSSSGDSHINCGGTFKVGLNGGTGTANIEETALNVLGAGGIQVGHGTTQAALNVGAGPVYQSVVTTTNDFSIAYGAGSSATGSFSNSTFNIGRDMYVGTGGATGTLTAGNVNLNISRDFFVGRLLNSGPGNAAVNLDGVPTSCRSLYVGIALPAPTFTYRGGTLFTASDRIQLSPATLTVRDLNTRMRTPLFENKSGSTTIVYPDARIEVTNVFVNSTGAYLKGSGAVTGSLINYGAIQPGFSPGTLSLGTVTNGASGVVEIEIGGPGNTDLLNCSGTFTSAGGKFKFTRLPGFTPAIGQELDVLNHTGFVNQGYTIQDETGLGLEFDPNTGKVRVTTLPGYISGKIQVDTGPSDLSQELVEVIIRDADGVVVSTIQNVALTYDGFFAVPTTAIGNLTVAVKGTNWLRKQSASISVTGSGYAGLNLSAQNGDVDGDNEVGPGDFEAVVALFGLNSSDAGFDQNADLDRDLEVGPSDFEIVVSHFGLAGDL
jgi:hypothetical protein